MFAGNLSLVFFLFLLQKLTGAKLAKGQFKLHKKYGIGSFHQICL